MTAMSVIASAISLILLASGLLTRRVAEAKIDPETYYLLRRSSDLNIPGFPPKYLYANEDQNEFEQKEVTYLSSDDTSDPRYHWRFTENDDGSFTVTNRGTGRVICEDGDGNLVTVVSLIFYSLKHTPCAKKFESSDLIKEEVETYYAADKNEDDTVDISILDNKAIQQEIIAAGLDIASKLSLFPGYSFGVNLVLNLLQLKYSSEQYSMTEILTHLAEQILNIAENIAERKISENTVATVISNMNHNRNWFAGEGTYDYPNVLLTALVSQNMGDFKEQVLGNLDTKIADHIDDIVKGLVDSNYAASSNYDVNIRVAQDGWPILTFGMIEVAAMLEEYTWARAYYNFKHLKSLYQSGTDNKNEYESKCDNSGLVHDVLAKFPIIDSTNSFINILEAQQEMLTDRRKNLFPPNLLSEKEKYTWKPHWSLKPEEKCMVRCKVSEHGDPANNEVVRGNIYKTDKNLGWHGTDVFSKSCGQKYSAYSTNSCNNFAAWGMYQEETLWDMKYFSYDMEEEKQFFGGFEQILLDICKHVKADPDASYTCKSDNVCMPGYSCCIPTARCVPDDGSVDCPYCESDDDCGEGDKCSVEEKRCRSSSCDKCQSAYNDWAVTSTDLIFDDAWAGHKTNCADSDYDIFVTAEPHIRMVAIPSQNRLDVNCPSVILHASIQDNLQMNKEVMFTMEETDFKPHDIVWVGKRSFSQIAKVFEMVKIDPAKNLYDVVHSNCGAIVLEAGLMLDIFPEKSTIDFIVGKLVEDGTVIKAIRAPGSNIQSIFGDDTREMSELRTNEELLFRLIENYVATYAGFESGVSSRTSDKAFV